MGADKNMLSDQKIDDLASRAADLHWNVKHNKPEIRTLENKIYQSDLDDESKDEQLETVKAKDDRMKMIEEELKVIYSEIENATDVQKKRFHHACDARLRSHGYRRLAILS